MECGLRSYFKIVDVFSFNSNIKNQSGYDQ